MKATFQLSILAAFALYAMLMIVRTGAIRDERRLRDVRERGLDASASSSPDPDPEP
ncbi:MAG: hypothetical protein HS111_03100 [Kofleriaceae bacterium]|nr:hypothetical protein [Kofleriaceae bacterium]